MSTAPDFNAITVESLRRRRGTKWNRYPSDVLPAWVADMDFAPAEPIRAGLERMMVTGDLGYSPKLPASGLPEAFAAWAARHFPGWTVAPDRIIAIADIVQGIHLAIEAYTRPGDGICTLTPVYPPFLQAVAETGRRLDDCTMMLGDGRYEIDFDGLRAAIDGRTRLLLLCTPHNPLGRVFERAELDELARIRARARPRRDRRRDPRRHRLRRMPAHSVRVTRSRGGGTNGDHDERDQVVQHCGTSLRAVVAFGSERLAARFDAWPERIRGAVNGFGVEATRIAWSECDEWLEALLAHLESNRDFLHAFVRERLPGLRMVLPEATYLGWLDCRQYDLAPDPYQWFLDRGRVGFNDGRDFGNGGEGHVRINFATSRGILTQVLERMEEALQ